MTNPNSPPHAPADDGLPVAKKTPPVELSGSFVRRACRRGSPPPLADKFANWGETALHYAKRHSVPAVFLMMATGGLHFALTPNVQGDIFATMPGALRRWCGSHDDLCNFLFFAALSLLAFWIPASKSPAHSGRGTPQAAPWRPAVLLGVVVTLEIAQIWISGRFSSLRDVLTGWSGVLVAWLFVAWLSYRNLAGVWICAKRKSND